MNRTEQREILKDIIDLANQTIKNLNSKIDWLDIAIKKIEDLGSYLSEIGEVDDFNEDDLIESIRNSFFEHELEELYEMTDNFRDEIDSYAMDLSENRQEKLYERYELLEDVCEKFDQSTSQYEDVENLIENIEEAIGMLREMRK